jgi:hypothetical protein
MVWLVIILVVWLLARSAANGAIRLRPRPTNPPAVVIVTEPEAAARRYPSSHPRVALQGRSAWVIGVHPRRKESAGQAE